MNVTSNNTMYTVRYAPKIATNRFTTSHTQETL